MARILRVPNKHARDWYERLGSDCGAKVIAQTERTITLSLPDAALRDLIGDTLYYAEEMGPQETGDIDYRPAARRLLVAFDRVGVKYTRRAFTITLLEA